MIRDNQRTMNILHVVIDALVIAAAYVFSWFVMVDSGIFNPGAQVLAPRLYMSALVIIIPVYLILYYIFDLYTPMRVQSFRAEFANILKANGIGILLFALVLFLGGKNPYLYNFSRRLVIAFCVVNILAESLERNLIRLALHYIRSKGYNQKNMLLVGYSRTAERYIDRILANPDWGYKVKGILDDHRERGAEYKGVEVLGGVNDLQDILDLNWLDEIAITLSIDEYANLKGIVAMCEKSGVHTQFVPDYNDFIPTVPDIEDLQGIAVINIRHVPLNDPLNAFIKRMMDVVGSILCIIIFSPVMLVTAIAIKVTSPGPVLFKQERVGLHNRPFMMYKFRSMVEQDPDEEEDKWTVPDDPRVTKVGKFIRRTSIDELPQLFNVLIGNMSLVGPRPERPQFVERFKEEIPRYMIKHQVRPGMTGWAQVNGYRGDTSIEKRIEYDLYYIENWTVGFDLKILFLTIFRGFVNKNAY